MALSRRQKAVFLLIGVLLSVAIPVALVGAETFLSSFYSAANGVTYNAPNGPAIKLGVDVEMRSGNPFGSGYVNISTNNSGTVVFRSPSSGASATVQTLTDPWTNLSSVGVSSASLSIEPADKENVTISGGVSAFRYRSPVVGDGDPDFRYAATSTGTLEIEDLEADHYYAIETAGGETIDTNQSDGSGTATFSLDTRALTLVEIREQNTSERTGFYVGSSTTVENESYFEGRQNATLDNVVNMLTRLGTFIVGTDSGETALSGGATLFFGAIVWAGVLAMSSWSRTGMVGGGVLGTVTVAGLVTAGLAPLWLWAVVLFVLGILAARPILRVVS